MQGGHHGQKDDRFDGMAAGSAATFGQQRRRRRHSINLVQDAPEPFQILSRCVLASPGCC